MSEMELCYGCLPMRERVLKIYRLRLLLIESAFLST